MKEYHLSELNPLSREVIVKQIEWESEELAATLLEEGRVLMSLPHPNIGECLDFVKEEKQGGGLYVYIVRPPVQKTLAHAIYDRFESKSCFSEEELWKIARQLISVCAFLQKRVTLTQNIPHRNINTRNIQLDSEGNTKICNFGFAKAISSGDRCRYLTPTGNPFLSPALRRASIMGEKNCFLVKHDVFKSDVYSLGLCFLCATIIELSPFCASLRNLQKNITDRLDQISNYSSDWVNLLKLMLTVEESKRPDFLSLETR